MHTRYALVLIALALGAATAGHAQSGASASSRPLVAGDSLGDRFSSMLPEGVPQATLSKLTALPPEAAGPHRSVWRGALIGGLVTATAAALIAGGTCGHDDGRSKSSCPGVVVRSAVIALPVGAILGAGLASTGRR
jgi:hypothetical protein